MALVRQSDSDQAHIAHWGEMVQLLKEADGAEQHASEMQSAVPHVIQSRSIVDRLDPFA